MSVPYSLLVLSIPGSTANTFGAACLRFGVLAVGLVLALAGCSAGGRDERDGAPDIRAGDQVYVSIGDSYAAGYQPQSRRGGSTSQSGFAYQLVAKAAMKGRTLRLINFGCSGETTTQIVDENGCQAAALGPGAPAYPDTPQSEAALDVIKTDPAAIKLVTMVMGGNDVAGCLTAADQQQCIEQAIPTVQRNVSALVAAIRREVGPSVKIVGLTYPDAFLGEYLRGTPAAVELAGKSRELFKNYLNPALKKSYADNGADFVDITALSGAYGPIDQTTTVNPYGVLPLPVARVCRLTFYCQYHDVHPTTSGYSFIADHVLQAAQS